MKIKKTSHSKCFYNNPGQVREPLYLWSQAFRFFVQSWEITLNFLSFYLSALVSYDPTRRFSWLVSWTSPWMRTWKKTGDISDRCCLYLKSSNCTWKVLLWIENKQSFQNKSPIFTPRRSASRQIKREFSLQCLFVLFFSHRRCLWNKNNSFFFLYLCRCTLPSVMLIRSEDGPIAGNSSIFKTAGIKRIYIYIYVCSLHTSNT